MCATSNEREKRGTTMANNLLQDAAFAVKLRSFVCSARKSGLRSPHGVTGGVDVGPIRAWALTLSNTADSR